MEGASIATVCCREVMRSKCGPTVQPNRLDILTCHTRLALGGDHLEQQARESSVIRRRNILPDNFRCRLGLLCHHGFLRVFICFAFLLLLLLFVVAGAAVSAVVVVGVDDGPCGWRRMVFAGQISRPTLRGFLFPKDLGKVVISKGAKQDAR